MAPQVPKQRKIKAAIAVILPILTLALGYALSRLMAPDVLDVSGYKFTPIATEAAYEGAPMWSPDSRSMVYSADVKGTNQLFVRSLDSPTPVQITRGTLWCRAPFWHPKEPRIFFLVRTGKDFGLVSPDGKTWRALNKEPYQRTAWSADGLKLYALRRVNNIEIFSSIDLQTGADTVLRKLSTDWYFQDPVDIGQTFSLNPDGNSFMVTAKHTRSDIWMLEGFRKP